MQYFNMLLIIFYKVNSRFLWEYSGNPGWITVDVWRTSMQLIGIWSVERSWERYIRRTKNRDSFNFIGLTGNSTRIVNGLLYSTLWYSEHTCLAYKSLQARYVVYIVRRMNHQNSDCPSFFLTKHRHYYYRGLLLIIYIYIYTYNRYSIT